MTSKQEGVQKKKPQQAPSESKPGASSSASFILPTAAPPSVLSYPPYGAWVQQQQQMQSSYNYWYQQHQQNYHQQRYGWSGMPGLGGTGPALPQKPLTQEQIQKETFFTVGGGPVASTSTNMSGTAVPARSPCSNTKPSSTGLTVASASASASSGNEVQGKETADKSKINELKEPPASITPTKKNPSEASSSTPESPKTATSAESGGEPSPVTKKEARNFPTSLPSPTTGNDGERSAKKPRIEEKDAVPTTLAELEVCLRDETWLLNNLKQTLPVVLEEYLVAMGFHFDDSKGEYKHDEIKDDSGQPVYFAGPRNIRELLIRCGIPNRDKLTVEARFRLELWMRHRSVVDGILHSRAKLQATGLAQSPFTTTDGYTFKFVTLTESEVVKLLEKSYQGDQPLELFHDGKPIVLTGIASSKTPPIWHTLGEIRVLLRKNAEFINQSSISDPNERLALEMWVASSPVPLPLFEQYKVIAGNTNRTVKVQPAKQTYSKSAPFSSTKKAAPVQISPKPAIAAVKIEPDYVPCMQQTGNNSKTEEASISRGTAASAKAAPMDASPQISVASWSSLVARKKAKHLATEKASAKTSAATLFAFGGFHKPEGVKKDSRNLQAVSFAKTAASVSTAAAAAVADDERKPAASDYAAGFRIPPLLGTLGMDSRINRMRERRKHYELMGLEWDERSKIKRARVKLRNVKLIAVNHNAAAPTAPTANLDDGHSNAPAPIANIPQPQESTAAVSVAPVSVAAVTANTDLTDLREKREQYQRLVEIKKEKVRILALEVEMKQAEKEEKELLAKLQAFEE